MTPRVREEFALRRGAAQLAFDTRIAARIAADPAPYHRYIRGGVPDSAQWAEARYAARRDLGEAADEAALRAQLAELAAGLGRGARAAVAEVHAAGITVTRTGLDSSGAPWLAPEEGSPWTALLPMLSAAEAERHFQLAGGLRPLDRAAITDRLRAGLPGAPDGGALVVCRPAGWPVLEWAAAALVSAWPGVRLLRVAGETGGMAAADVLAAVTTEAPLWDAYRLKVAVADDDSGQLHIRDRLLFAPGDIPGTEARVSLRRPPGDDDRTALAVFSDGAGPDEPLALYTVPLPAEEVFGLHAILDGPGRLRIVAPPGAAAHPGTWDQIRGEIPARVEVTMGPADLVCAVDLAGPVPEVRRRMRLVRLLLEHLAGEYPAPSQLRVAVLTCTDHVFERGLERRRVVQDFPFGPAAEAADWFARQRAADVSYALAAPIEDLLGEAAELLAGSRPAGRAPRLLLLSGRGPHPFPRGTEAARACPRRYRWRASLERLTNTARARCVAVTDALPADDAAAAVWDALGPAGLHILPEVTAQQVGRDLGLLATRPQRIPIPLPDKEPDQE